MLNLRWHTLYLKNTTIINLKYDYFFGTKRQWASLLSSMDRSSEHILFFFYFSDIFDAMFPVHRHTGEVIIQQGKYSYGIEHKYFINTTPA